MQATAEPPATDLEPVAAPVRRARPRRTLVALLASAGVLLVVLLSTLLLGPPSLGVPALSALGGLPSALLVAMAALLAVVGVVLRNGRRPGDSTDALVEQLSDPEAWMPGESPRLAGAANEEADDEPAGESVAQSAAQPAHPAEASDKASTTRTLEFQVRCLEATLAEHDDLLQEALTAAADRVEEARDAERQRVRHVLSAIRDAVADQRGEVALSRVESALDRLGHEAAVARPLLSVAGSSPLAFAPPRSFQTSAGAAHAPTPADAPRPTQVASVAAAAPAETPAETPADGVLVAEGAVDADAHPASAAPPPAVASSPPKVLPVPAPVVAAGPQRRRRGLRRSAA